MPHAYVLAILYLVSNTTKKKLLMNKKPKMSSKLLQAIFRILKIYVKKKVLLSFFAN